jgi:hypothetical protein
MKDIKDYLHLYIGCQAEVINIPDGLAVTEEPQIHLIDGTVMDCSASMYSSIKPILRSLSSMTEEEQTEMVATQDTVKLDGYPEIVLKADSGETFRYMLSKGFDLFGLIESGLAIEKVVSPTLMKERT